MLLYAATTNAGKLRDFAAAAKSNEERGGGVEIVALPGLEGIEAPAEDEATFEGNARVKAVYYSRLAPEKMVLADDSGLEVTCLDGAPGVRSARYAEDERFPSSPGSTVDERNNAALLRALDGVPEACREGQYRCVLAVARDGEVVATAEGTLEGRILAAPRGSGGFGYDPLFLLEELGVTMAEVDVGRRVELSHRGRALRALMEALRGSGI
jgi:XTP/dITP diphosphohydrolase